MVIFTPLKADVKGQGQVLQAITNPELPVLGEQCRYAGHAEGSSGDRFHCIITLATLQQIPTYLGSSVGGCLSLKAIVVEAWQRSWVRFLLRPKLF